MPCASALLLRLDSAGNVAVCGHLFVCDKKQLIIMRNRVFLLFAVLCSFMVQSAMAQSFKVRGQVTSSEDGEGMISLTIMQKGTSNATVRSGEIPYPFRQVLHRHSFASFPLQSDWP